MKYVKRQPGMPMGLLNTKEAAAFLAVSPRVVYALVKQGRVRALYPTGTRRSPRYSPNDLIRASQIGRWHALRTPNEGLALAKFRKHKRL